MTFSKRIATTFLTALLISTGSIAEEGGHLKLTTTVQKEQVTLSASGDEKRELVEAATVTPGESVVYTITFENVSNEPAENVTITNPVPANLTYEPGSAVGPNADILFSVDGGDRYDAPEALTVTEDGEVRNARPEDYTHIRWVMNSDVEAGAEGTASFRARLN